MKKILITGGTAFVSRYAASYYVERGDEVYVLNRGRSTQVEGVHWIKGDRNDLTDELKGHHFDAVLDITAYTRQDVADLLAALDTFDDYILISSSAVYPESSTQPFREDRPVGHNKIWKEYGTNKIAAEQYLLERIPTAYVLRPPYLYGPMQNIYRELFVFDCALQDRPFYLPGDGSMPLQFFYIEDLCRFMDILIEKRPEQRTFNVGNKRPVSVREWVEICYEVCGKTPTFVYVEDPIEQRDYFPFYRYAYHLDVSRQESLMPKTESLYDGLRKSLEYYIRSDAKIDKRGYAEFIKRHLENR
ncbi:MAG: NAD-dependent epimerase/dehydratase family protein [Peptostreptococcaceae bacterium]|nr:NAD-dependent epimerase/dehydratase family protein [Peptostreptococcaceae bacterium]